MKFTQTVTAVMGGSILVLLMGSWDASGRTITSVEGDVAVTKYSDVNVVSRHLDTATLNGYPPSFWKNGYLKPIILSDDGQKSPAITPGEVTTWVTKIINANTANNNLGKFHYEHLDTGGSIRVAYDSPDIGTDDMFATTGDWQPESLACLRNIASVVGGAIKNGSLPDTAVHFAGTSVNVVSDGNVIKVNGKKAVLIGFGGLGCLAVGSPANPARIMNYDHLFCGTWKDSSGEHHGLQHFNVNYIRVLLVSMWDVADPNSGDISSPPLGLTPFVQSTAAPYQFTLPTPSSPNNWNEDFFSRLLTLVQTAQKYGIVVHVTLFDRCGLRVGSNVGEWNQSPYNGASGKDNRKCSQCPSNTNGCSKCDTNGCFKCPNNTNGLLTSVDNFCCNLNTCISNNSEGPALWNSDKLLIQKCITTLRTCHNVMWEVLNEPGGLYNEENWQEDVATFLATH